MKINCPGYIYGNAGSCWDMTVLTWEHTYARSAQIMNYPDHRSIKGCVYNLTLGGLWFAAYYEAFEYNSGAKEGCKLAPILFGIYAAVLFLTCFS